MTADPIVVPPDLSIDGFVEGYIYRHHHREFPVVCAGVLVGRIGTKEVAAVDRSLWQRTEVTEVMVPYSPADTVAPRTAVLDAIAQMSSTGRSHLFVVRADQLIGVISQRDFVDLLSVKLELVDYRDPAGAALAERHSQRATFLANKGEPG